MSDVKQRAREALDDVQATGNLIAVGTPDGGWQVTTMDVRTATLLSVAPVLVRELLAALEVAEAERDEAEAEAELHRAETRRWRYEDRMRALESEGHSKRADDALAALDEANHMWRTTSGAAEMWKSEANSLKVERDEARGQVEQLQDENAQHRVDLLGADMDIRRLRGQVERVEAANNIASAHRFDLDDVGIEQYQRQVEHLASLGERPCGGPDIFYNGVSFATRRVRAALRGDSGE